MAGSGLRRWLEISFKPAVLSTAKVLARILGHSEKEPTFSVACKNFSPGTLKVFCFGIV